MQITILAFGQVAGVTGNEFVITDEIKDTTELQTYLQKKYPPLIEMKYALAVDKKMVGEKVNLHGGETVAILPPFSGG